MLSGSHILLLLIVVFVLFGAGKLPSVMGDLAKGVRNFKKGLNEEDEAPQAKLTETKKDDAPTA